MPRHYRIQELLDIPKLQALMDSLYQASGISSALIDPEGNVLTHSGWQEICTKFHRSHPRARQECIDSNKSIINANPLPNRHFQKTCPRGLQDTAIPLIIEGQHLANVFSGQFLVSPPDREHFRLQAREFGFDEEAYLAALDKVPIVSQEQLDRQLSFIANLAEMLISQGLERQRNLSIKEALENNQERLRITLTEVRAGTWEWDIANNRCNYDEAYQNLFSLEPGSLPCHGRIHPEDLDSVKRARQEAVEHKKKLDIEYRIVLPDGRIRWMRDIGSPFYDGAAATRMLGMSQDITDKKQAEQALREREVQYRNLANSGMALIWSSSTDTLCNYVNEPWLAFTGRTLEQELGNGWAEGVHPDDRDRCLATYATAFEKREPFDMEYRLRHHSGTYRWIQDVGTPNYNSDGEFIGYIGHCFDITSRKETDEALRASVELFRTLTTLAPVGIYLTGPNGNCRYVNPGWCAMAGISLEEALGQGWMAALHPDDRESVVAEWKQMVASKGQWGLEYRFQTPEGRVTTVYGLATPIKDKRGTITGYVGVNLDITDRKQQENALQENEKRLAEFNQLLSGVLEHTHIKVAFLDPQFNFIWVNRGYAETCGHPVSFFPGKNHFDLYPQTENQAIFQKVVESCLPFFAVNKPFDYPDQPERGTTYWDWGLTPIVSDDGKTTGLVVTLAEVTDRIRAEEEKAALTTQLNQAQKMEAIGVLAGGIAHDFNNILGSIIGYSELAREDVPADSVLASDLDRVLASANRAKDLVKQILAFSRQSVVDRIPLKIQPLLKESLKMLRASLPTTIAIKDDILPKTGVVLADPTQIHQIVVNLCTNAFHAMEQTGGVLTVVLDTMRIEASDALTITQDLAPGDYVRLSVSDTGTGIGPDIIGKIFDPYFTTKELGKGTGLGLSITHGIVKSYGGAITVESALGEGSAFHVFFPVVEESAVETETASAALSGTERLLLVDDEQLLLEMEQFMLERLGYTVVGRQSGIEALEAFQQSPDAFDLVITDQTMPGMTGTELAQRLLQIRPELPVILCTGFSNLINEESAKAIGIKEFALKPLTKESLGRLIRKIFTPGA